MADTSTALVPTGSDLLPASPAVRDVTQRVERLEDVVAVLCDTKAMEDRIVQRVTAQLSARADLPRTVTGQVEGPGLSALHLDGPHVNGTPPGSSPPTATFADFDLTEMGSQASAFSLGGIPLRAAPTVKVGVQETTVKLSLAMLPGTSLLRSIWWDIKTFLALWRDPLYTMTMACRIIPLVALFCVLGVPLLRKLPIVGDFIPNFGDIIGNLLNLVLLYVAFKVTHRELQRYHEFATKYHR